MNASRWGNSRLRLVLLQGLVCLWGCAPEPESEVHHKLDVLLEDDLQTIVKEIEVKDSASVLAKPYFQVTDYERFPKNSQFSHKAVAHFYYLRSVQMMQTRMYRYEPQLRGWQRFHKSLEFDLHP